MKYNENTVKRALQMVMEKAQEPDGTGVTDASNARRLCQLLLAEHIDTCEQFGVLFLNSRHQLIKAEVLFTGSIDRAQVYPREVLRRSLLENAAAVVITHNHPSGNPEPSGSDIRLTERLKRLLSEIDVRLLDHMVIASDGRSVSMSERGLI